MAKIGKKIDRRAFIKAAGIGGASLALSSGFSGNNLTAEEASEKPSDNSGMPTRILGKTGVPLSILSLGGGVDWTINQTLLKVAYNKGINAWDTAYIYENGKSELGLGQYFEKYPEDRKNIFLTSKCFSTYDPKTITEQLNTSLERLKTDYIDFYALHQAEKPEVFTSEIKDLAERLKKEGKIRFFGFSCHANMAQMLIQASKLAWIDAIATSYNFNIMNDDGIKKGIDACYKANIGLITMKSQALFFDTPYYPFGPAKDDDLKITEFFMAKGYTPHQAKLKAVWTDERIASCLSEMKNLTMLKENVAAAVDNKQFSRRDMEMLNRLTHANRDFYCQGCMICESAMSSESRIHDILRYMMYYNSYGERDEARRLFRALPASVKNSLASKDYSTAENACPRNIKISKMMRKAAKILG
jgi:hypothetical protein